MPRLDEQKETTTEKSLVRLLLIADGKAGKSHYAGMAAAAGYNVLYLDGDVATPTLMKLPEAARKRIYLMLMADKAVGGRSHDFNDHVVNLMNATTFVWHDEKQREGSRRDETGTHWRIRPARLDHRDVLVIDSWTALTESIMLKCAQANGIDLSMATTTEMRPVYQSAALIATSVLQTIRSMPCHVIVLGHPDEYTHLIKPDNRKAGQVREGDMVIDYTKLIAKTTSKPQGLVMPKYFTDVAWLEVSPSGERRINFKPKKDRVGGGHFDGIESADNEYSFVNLVKEVGGYVPKKVDSESPEGRWLEIVDVAKSHEQRATKKVLDGTESKPVKGLAALTGKKD